MPDVRASASACATLMTSAILQAINGVSLAALLFLLASGFTLSFGLMRVVNMAHGAYYLLGGYVGLSIARGDRQLRARAPRRRRWRWSCSASSSTGS